MNIIDAITILSPLCPKKTGSNCFTWADLVGIAEHINTLNDKILEQSIELMNRGDGDVGQRSG